MTNKIYHVTTPWGYKYSFEIIPISDALHLIELTEGEELKEWTKLSAHGKVYLLNNGKVLRTSYGDATVYSSLKAYLSNLQTSGMHIQKHISTQTPIQFISYGLDNQKIIYHKISEQEWCILKNASQAIQKKGYLIYNTHEGEVLWGDNFLFPDMNSFESFQDFELLRNKEIKARWGQGNLDSIEPDLKGRNPYGRGFPKHTTELVQKLKDLINCPDKILNYKESSLKKLERYLYLKAFNADFADKVFLPLLAYIGEIHIKNIGGKWAMKHDQVFNHWYPDIKMAGSTYKGIFRPIQKIIDYTNDTYYPLRIALQ